MKIIFFGTPKFAVPTLETLNKNSNIEILAVVTQPDKPVGRKKTLTPSPVKVSAKDLNLKILQPKNKEELNEMLKPFQANFFIVMAYGMIFPPETLKMPKNAAINVHASLLPKYRGASPIQESLLRGDKETGISIMKMDKKLDEGDIYLIKRIIIDEKDNLHTLSEKLSKISSNILPHILDDILEGQLQAIPQDKGHEKVSYCRKIKKEDGRIDWDKPAEEIRDMIRAYTPWPSAFTEFNGKKLKILEAEVSEEQNPPGKFILTNNTLKIGAKKGSLIPKKVQLEGKKEMDINVFINGYKNTISQIT